MKNGYSIQIVIKFDKLEEKHNPNYGDLNTIGGV